MKSNTTKIMPTIWMVIFSIAFLVIAGRFLYIQISGEVSGVSIEELAKEKRTNHYTIPASRGTIYDRNGMALAQEHEVYRLYAIVDEEHSTNPLEPKHVKDVSDTAEKLSPILDIKAEKIAEILNKGINTEGQFQVEFGPKARELNQEQKEQIEKLALPGIQFIEEPIRFYPNGKFASRTIGLTDKKEDQIVGINGMESLMNDLLSGIDGSISYQRDKFNVKLLDPNEVINKPKNGDDVYLTIDQKIQTLLEDAMTEVMKEYNPTRVSAMVMNSKTGEILALSNRPSYNPNELGEVDNWFNDIIATPIEPGSTMKIFTLASAIEEGVWNPNEMYKSGTYQAEKNTKVIGDHNGHRGWGTISYLEGIQRSSNVAAAKLAYEKIGSEKFLEYLHAFDFDKKTGVDLPGEVAGHIQYDAVSEKVTSAYGQGSTVTPIQLVKAATAITNEGNMLQPYIIDKIVDHDTNEIVTKKEPEVIGNPISKKTSKDTLDILETVISSEKGTGHNIYNLNDYTVAGKTGTASFVDPETKTYQTGKGNYIYSFLGMAPADDPELIMYVSVKEPELEVTEAGSAPVSFVFKNVMENSLRYLEIQPDKEMNEQVNTIKIPEWEGKRTKAYTDQLKELGLSPIVLGDGEKIDKISHKVGTKITSQQKVIIKTNRPKMPNVIGWSLRDFLVLKDLMNLDAEWVGEGYIVKQSMEKGSLLNEQDYLMVEFKKPHNTTGEAEEEETS